MIEIAASELELAAEDTDLSGSLVEEVGVESKEEDPPNPVLPTTNEIFWSAIFFLLLWALMKFVLLPPIRAIQKKRTEQIEAGQQTEDTTTEEKEKLIREREETLVAVRQEVSQIMDEARQRAESYRSDVMSKVSEELGRQEEQNEVALAEAKQAALQSMREDMFEITYQAAGMVLGKDPDRDLVTSRIKQTGVEN